jgi:hypothetical protein
MSEDILPVGGGPSQIDCTDQNKVPVKVGRDHFDGDHVRTKMPALVLKTDHGVQVTWHMLDMDGNNVNLTNCGFGSSSISEAPSSSSVTPDGPSIYFKMGLADNGTSVISKYGSVLDAEVGKVAVTLTPDEVSSPGIYFGEFAVINASEQIQFSNRFFVIVSASLFSGGSLVGPPSIAEIRLFLRDNGANDNELLDHVDFDDAEIAMAALMCIQYWNEVDPPLDTVYTSENFPFRHHWLLGICGNLYYIAAEHYLRNKYQHQGQGASYDDKNKDREYMAKGKMLTDEWKMFVRQKKTNLNQMGWFGHLGSTYGRPYY